MEQEDSDIDTPVQDETDEDKFVLLQTHSSQARSKPKRKGTEAFVPVHILKSPKLVTLATRMKMTP